MGKQGFPVRGRPLQARVSFRKKWRETVSTTSHAASPSLREMPTQGGAPDPAGTPWFRKKNGPRFLQGVRRGLSSPILAVAKNSLQIPFIALSIFLLSRPYRGIVQDAYITWAARSLISIRTRDLMFVHDGQFGFSLFRLATAALVQCLGLAAAAKTLAILVAFAWFFGIRAFAQQFASGATVWVAVIFTVLLPNVYGAPYPFGFADLIAIPRPFAEALVFVGLAAVAARRDVVAILVIVAAALLQSDHGDGRIGSLGYRPPYGRQALDLVLRYQWCSVDRSGRARPALGGPAFHGNRSFLAELARTAKPVFVSSLWPAESFPPLIVQASTLAIAAHFQHGRTILGAIILIGLKRHRHYRDFGDWLSSLLIFKRSLGVWHG
jgi:hypothetical protein